VKGCKVDEGRWNGGKWMSVGGRGEVDDECRWKGGKWMSVGGRVESG
jgi:hypothetical protein